MEKKYGVNIMLFVFIAFLFFNLSCTSEKVQNHKRELIAADSLFSELSVKKGMIAAFTEYMAPDGAILRNNSLPTKGIDGLNKYYEGKSDTSFILSWKPEFESISDDGTLGYTYGIWTYTLKSSGEKSYGMYATVWKKQDDGSWKFVLDLGTDGLPVEAL
jgi:ketosteroid isomerase-like protein